MRIAKKKAPAALGMGMMVDRSDAADVVSLAVLHDSLGEQAALITHHMDRWFEQVQQRLENLSAGTRPLDPVAEVFALPPAPPIVPAPKPEPEPETLKSDGEAFPTFSRPSATDPVPPLVTDMIVSLDARGSWDDWKFHQAVRMHPEGLVELRQDKSTPGVVSRPVPLPRTGLLRITVDCVHATGAGLPRPQLRLLDGADRPLGPDMELATGVTELFAFATHRATSVRVFIIAAEPQSGFTFVLTKVDIETVDPESFFKMQRARALAPAIASMASIPARRPMLADCVASLLVQCDKVRVFLNGYPDVPAFLDHPRVEVRRSQDWDDKGDAGKFGWIEQPDAPGYRIIVDDDLVFPPDFVERLSDKVNASGNRAIYAMHGVLLKQPVTAYYDPESRTVFHFQNAVRQDLTCHVLGTNALCYFSDAVRMTWADFMFRNMADIFLARYAQEHGLPMVTPSRPAHWVRQNGQEGGFDTIYDSSLKKTRSKFDSSAIQDALVKWCHPLTLQPTQRVKIVFLLIASTAEAFEAALKSWATTRWMDYDWVIVAVSGSDDADVRQAVRAAKAPHEMHIVDPKDLTAPERLAAAVAFSRRLGFDLLCVASDNIRFQRGVWTRPVVGRCTGKGGGALFLSAAEQGTRIEVRSAFEGRSLPIMTMASRDLVERTQPLDAGVPTCSAALGGWLADLSRVNAGGRDLDAKDSDVIAEAVSAAPGHPEAGWAPPATAIRPPAASALPPTPALMINEFFEKVFVINLDRRADRWSRATARLRAVGIEAERFPAVDGSDPEVKAEFDAYKTSPLLQPGDVTRKIDSTKRFYQDYDSEAARVAFIEQKDKRKAIQSAGAWGYLKSWERILERVLEERMATTLVLDDDVAFHKKSTALFAAAAASLPDDWLILQLGTLQYHWTPEWVNWHGQFLYRTNGSAVGSHAVGFKFEVAPFLLEHVKRMLLPFDTGALAMATRAFKDRCYVVYPNVAIQALQEVSDISTSEFQKGTDHIRAAETYRWHLPFYAD